MDTGQRDRRAIVRQLRRMLRAKPNDAVKLAFLDKTEGAELGRLDLTPLSEFKRSSTGVVEIKLQDRIKAMELLERLAGQGEDGASGAEAFYQALEQSAGWEECDGT